MEMGASIVSLPILLLLGLWLLGGVALVVVLLVNPGTRPVGIALAVLGGLLVCAGVVAIGVFFAARIAPMHTMEVQPTRTEALAPLEQLVHDGQPAFEWPPAEIAETLETAPSEQPAGQPWPPWVESRPQRVDDGYQMSLTVGPYTSRLECDTQLPAALQAAVDEYVSIYLGPQWSGRIRLPADILETELVKEQWEETIQASVGPMVQLHVLLQFDSKFRQTVCELRDRTIVAARLWYAGTGLGVLLAWLGLAFAFLRIDQATAGAYRGRLVAGCILCAVAVLLAAGMVLRVARPAPLAFQHVPAVGQSGQALSVSPLGRAWLRGTS